MIFSIICIILAYFCGSLSSAILVCQLLALPDPRTQGSGNPGATNVLRIGGKTAALVVLLGDIFKGVVPVLLAHYLQLPDWALGATTLAAVLGHTYPIFFKFQGGKGVATNLGTLTALHWPMGLVIIGSWLLTAGLFRYSSLASLVMALVAAVYAQHYFSLALQSFVFLISLLIFWRHRSNILRLVTGTESKIGESSK